MKRLGMIGLLAISSLGFGLEYQFAGGGEAEITIKRKDKVLQRAKGRVALNLESSTRELKRGEISIRDLNILALGVRQKLLSGKRPKGKRTSGVGFVVKYGKKLPQMKYSKRAKALQAKLKGKVDYSQLAELTKASLKNNQDALPLPQLPAEAILTLPTNAQWMATASKCGPFQLIETMQLTISVGGWNGLDGFQMEIFVPRVEIHWGCTEKFSSWRELCVRPVSIKSSASDNNPTGAGFSFGMPGAETQWAKAGVLFEKRPFVTVISSTLKTIDNSETTALRSEVQEDDCIEVFFAERFSPQAMFGGGAAFGLGTATSQVITSDENASFGVDLTHLAHELGHVMSLHHPNQGFPTSTSPTVFDGSTGSLMCGSGFNNDNPQINSVENADNISNPLFKFKLLKAEPTQPDCDDSADCGSC